jgi:hypothetical protein
VIKVGPDALCHVTPNIPYASIIPRIPAAGLIRQSSPQAKDLEVTGEFTASNTAHVG